MNRDFKAIKEIEEDFVSANKIEFERNKLANKQDFESTINLTAYHNVILADVVELFYDIQVQNINNLVDEIVITAFENPTLTSEGASGNAQLIHEQLLSSIDDDFGRFNAMDTQERYGLVSNLSVTFISPSVIERARQDILYKTMERDPTYQKDIMNHVRSEECEHFVDYAKNLNESFKRKYGKQLKELFILKEMLKPDTATPDEEPEQTKTKKLKVNHN